MVEIKDAFTLLHPAIAIIFVFPLIGMVINLPWQTRQRRLQTKGEGKSKIPPIVGAEHNRLGNWLTSAVVGVALLGLTCPIVKNILNNELVTKKPFQVAFIGLMFVVTIASLIFLYKSRETLWRGVFATLTGAGLVILGCQDGVYRLSNQWYWSHYYIGIVAALLIIFSLAIASSIYKDKSHRWRIIHTVLTSIALLLFIGQGMAGTRDLLQIPLSWQEPYIYQCNFDNKTCLSLPPKR